MSKYEDPHDKILRLVSNAKDYGGGVTAFDPRSLHGKPVPPRRWVVPDWIPVGYVTGLFGKGGIGKSMLTMQLLSSTALNRPWLGVPVTPIRSLGVFCEDDLDELHRRQGAINMELLGCDFDQLGNMRWLPRYGEDNLLMTWSRDGKAVTTPFYETVIEMARDERVNLVVLDTLADMYGGNQNDMGQARYFVQFALGRLARAIDGAVVICAHPSRTGQNNDTGESGSVQWDAAFRSRLYLSDRKDDDADPDERLLTRKKANYAKRDETIDLYWDNGVFHAAAPEVEGERKDAQSVFLELLDKFNGRKQWVSHKSRASNFAPKLFTDDPKRQGYKRRDFEVAMAALQDRGEVVIEQYGKPSDGHERLIRGVPMPF